MAHSNSAVSPTGTGPSDAQQDLKDFWPNVLDQIKSLTSTDLRVQELPLARIKKIMKLDEDVKMISAEAPVLFAKAAEVFIHELTLRAWIHTEDNKRRTLQRNDIAMAITKYDQFDFLIDIVPRDELKPTKKEESKTTSVLGADQVQYYLQIAQQAALQQGQVGQLNQVQLVNPSTGQVQTIQFTQSGQTTQVIQQPQILGQTLGGGQTVVQLGGTQLSQMFQAQQPQQGGIQLLQQVVCPNGEVQNIPIQLSASQLQMLRMQIQNNAAAQTNQNQQIILQTGAMQPTVVSGQNGTQIIHG